MTKVKFGPGSQPEFLGKRTSSGLWLLCYTQRERITVVIIIAITIPITTMINFTITFALMLLLSKQKHQLPTRDAQGRSFILQGKVLQNIVAPFSAHAYQMDFTIGCKAAKILHIFVF